MKFTFALIITVISLLGLTQGGRTVRNTVSSSSGSSCPSGWHRILDSCIWLSGDQKDFDSAQQQCAQLVHNGRLFEPKNRLQNDLVSTLVKSLQPSNAWIGITDRQSEGRFEYLSSGKEPSFSNWAQYQPDDCCEKGEDCVLFWFNWSNGNNEDDRSWRGKWNDALCDSRLHYVCEQPLTGLSKQLVYSFLKINDIPLFQDFQGLTSRPLMTILVQEVMVTFTWKYVTQTIAILAANKPLMAILKKLEQKIYLHSTQNFKNVWKVVRSFTILWALLLDLMDGNPM